MSSQVVASVVGQQRPRFRHIPPYVSSTGEEALELCRMAGMTLDPWEEFVLAGSLGERADGKWAALEVGVTVPRQNGKGEILIGRELVGLFLLGERMLVHSAHQFDTSLEAFRRLLFVIEDTPDFDRRVRRVVRSHGEEGIELKGGQRIRFRTRTKGGGRGFSGDVLILDEAMILPNSAHQALFPIVSARPNAQVWYTGSAVDQNVHEHGEVFTRIRERGLKGDDPRLMYVEWSADAEIDTVDEIAGSPEAWAQANPGLGIRISVEHVALEHRAMDPRAFAVERLGVGDWPSLDEDTGAGITRAMWAACEDHGSQVKDSPTFAFDVRPDRKATAICVAGRRGDDRFHIEVVAHRAGTGWVADELERLQKKHAAGPVIFDLKSPAAALTKQLVERGVEFEAIHAGEYAEACGMFFDDVAQANLRHLGTSELAAAVRGAAKRPLGDAWAWSRKSSAVDISPLVAATLARWGVSQDRPSVYESRGVLTV